MSNFSFLITDWPALYTTAREAEHNVASTPLRASAQPPETSGAPGAIC